MWAKQLDCELKKAIGLRIEIGIGLQIEIGIGGDNKNDCCAASAAAEAPIPIHM